MEAAILTREAGGGIKPRVSPRTRGEDGSSHTNLRSRWRPWLTTTWFREVGIGHQSFALSLQPAATLLRGFRCVPSTCPPRVRGLTRGFMPASLPGFNRKNVPGTN
jgi:hypothetical protein